MMRTRTSLAVMAATITLGVASLMLLRGPDTEHRTVGAAPSMNLLTIRDVTVQPWSSTASNAEPLRPAATRVAATTSAERADTDPLDGLSISRQRFQRGGLGSQALMSFTLRNRNDFAVSDIELRCAFKSRDGLYTTERRHVISDTMDMRSRKTIPYQLIGFVNARMSDAKCDVQSASRSSQG